MLFEGGFTFANFLVDILTVFVFGMLFWMLVILVGDLFARRDISGWGKALWVIFLIVIPFVGVFTYMIMKEGVVGRKIERARAEKSRSGAPASASPMRSASSTALPDQA